MGESKKKNWLKRGLALFLAFATILATSGINPGVFAAGNVSSVGTGGTIQQVFASTAPANGKMVLSGVKFNVDGAAMAENNISVHYTIYFNTELREENNLYTADTATAIASTSGDATAVISGDTATVEFGKTYDIAEGEYFAVELMNSSGTTIAFADQDATNPNAAGGYVNNNPISAVAMTAVASNASTLPNDVTSINLSATKTAIAKGETLPVTATLNSEVEGRKRNIKYSVSGGAATIDSTTGVLTATGAGAVDVTASYGGITSQPLHVYVVDASLANESVDYTGSAITEDDLGLTVTADQPLTKGGADGYTSIFNNNTNVGSATVKVRGTGKYAGFETTLPFTINRKEITDADVLAATKTASADGTVTINDLVVGGRTLKQGTDFTATASNPVYENDKVTYTVTVTGINNYTGTVDAGTVKSAYGAGNAIQLSSVFIAKVEGSYKYTGEEIEPTIALYNKSNVKIKDLDSSGDDDIEVKYSSNKKAGTALVTLTGKGNKYAGTLTAEFVIEKENLVTTFKNGYDAKYSSGSSFSQLTIEGIGDVTQNGGSSKYTLNKKYVYTGSDVTMKDLALKLQRSAGGGKTTLTAGEDYSVTYKNNSEIDLDSPTAKLEIEGKGNYTGKLIFSYYIIPDFAKHLSINLNGKSYTVPSASVSADGNTSSINTDYRVQYDGTEKTISPVVMLNGEIITSGTDYQMTVYENNVNAGTASLKITGLGDYAGKEVTVTYTITPLDLSEGEVTVSGTHFYNNGKEVVPDDSEVVVKATKDSSAVALLKDSDYTIKYADNKNAGEAKVTVNGKGNYIGTLKTTYEISKLDISSAQVNPQTDVTTGLVVRFQDSFAYTGNAIVPDVAIYNDGEKIFDSTDSKLKDNATVTATNNTKVTNKGAVLKITGAKNLEGTISTNFSITKRKFDNITISVAGKNAMVDAATQGGNPVKFTSEYEETYTYASSAIPEIIITDNGTGNTLSRGTDYTVSITNRNVNDNAQIMIYGVGSYAGSSAMISYKIKPRNIVDKDITITQTGFDTTNTALPVFEVVDKTSGLATALKADKDYKVVPVSESGSELSDWPAGAGVHHMKVVGKGNYTGETDVMEYERGNSLAKANVSLRNPGNNNITYGVLSSGAFNVPYIGNNRPFEYVTMLVGTETKVLKKGTDYEVAYDSDNYNAGTTVTVTLTAKDGSELYYGSTTFKYTIRKLSFAATSADATPGNLPSGVYDLNASEVASSTYFCGDQGVILVSDGNTPASGGTSSRVDYNTMFNYFYAHQGQVGGYEPLKPNVKLQYYALGKDKDPITLSATDISVTPALIDVNGLTSNRTFSVKIDGNGNYGDSIPSLSYSVSQADLQNATVSGYDTFTSGKDAGIFYTGYTGSPIDISKFALKEYGATLISRTDYVIKSIKYSQLKDGTATDVGEGEILNPGYYKITFAGTGDNTSTPVTGNYYGTKEITFKVTAREFNPTGYSVTGSDLYYYTGANITTGFVAKEGNATLTAGVDYEVAIFEGNHTSDVDFSALTPVTGVKSIGVYTVVFTGKGKYTGTLTKRFKVVGDLSKDNLFTVTPDTVTGTYSAANLTSAVDAISIKYTDGGTEKTVASTEYTKEAAAWTGIGTGDVTITGNCQNVSDDYLFIGTRTIKNDMDGDLSDANVVVTDQQADSIYAFSGENIKPRLKVTYYGQELNAGTDYEIQYEDSDINNTGATAKVGEYKYHLYGKGKFKNNTSIKSYYVEYNLKNVIVQFRDDPGSGWINSDNYSKEITGDDTANHPSYVRAVITIADGSTVELISGRDFNLTYSNDTAIGNVVVTLNPVDKVSYNEKKVTYNLTGKTLTDANTIIKLNGADEDQYNCKFTGTQITPTVEVTYTTGGSKVLQEGVDYTLQYGDNINAGGDQSGKVTVKGIGMYAGSVTETFRIKQVDITSSDVEVTIGDAVYSGQNQQVPPEIKLELGNYTLVEGKDYTVELGTPDTAARQSVTIKGKGNFFNTVKTQIVLQDRDITQSGAVTVVKEKIYDGKAINTKDVVLKVNLGTKDTDGNDVYATLSQGTEYTVTPVDSAGLSANVGSYSFIIDAVPGSHFTGQIIETVSIVPKDISSGDIEATLSKDSYEYTGNEVNPGSVVAKYNTKAVDDTTHVQLPAIDMISGTDYDISYENNTAAASKDSENAPAVVLTGKGNYTGTRKLTFNIGTDLAEAVAEYTDPNFTYNGKEHGLRDFEYSVKYKNKIIREGVDFQVGKIVDTGENDVHYKEEDIIHAGKKTVTLHGTGAFYGELKFSYHIKAKTISKDSNAIKIVFKDFVENEGKYETIYNGQPATSEIELYDLEIDKDNPIDTTNWQLYKEGEYEAGNGYKNNTNVSAVDNPAMVAITMKGDYDTGSDTLNQKFFIKGKTLEGLTLELRDAPNSIKDVNADRYPYDWVKEKPIKPEVIIHDGSNTLGLVEGRDYSIEYTNNETIGTATVKVTGKGNYTGVLEKEFIIYASLENAEVTLKADQYYYLGYGIVPAPLAADKIKSVKVGGVTLAPEDYVVTESSDNNYQTSGSLSIIPSTDGNMAPYLSKVATKDYEITSDLSLLKATDPSNPNFPNYEYTGSEIKPNFVVTQPDGSEIAYDKDNVKFYRVTAGGDVAVTELVEKGNYKAEIPLFKTDDQTRSLSVNFNITNPMINRSDINLKKTYVYNGEDQRFTVSIYKGSHRLEEGTDYTLTVVDATGTPVTPRECGDYYLIVKGMGDFAGSEVNFMTLDKPETVSITPDRAHAVKVVSVSNHQIYLEWNASNDVHGYEVTATKKGTDESVTVKTASTTYTLKELEGGTKYVIEVKPYVYDRDKGIFYYGIPKEVEQRTTILSPDKAETNTSQPGKVVINWNPNAIDIDGYEVYRSTTMNGTYSLAAVVPIAYASYTDTQVTSGRVYYYKLRSYKKENDGSVSYSTFSSIVEAKAP